MLSYALKRIIRSWKLFAALILGMVLASTFFGGINIGADSVGSQALDQQLLNTPVDIKLTPGYFGGSTILPSSTFESAAAGARQVQNVLAAETRGNAGVHTGINGTQARMSAIPDGSLVYQHLTITGQRPQLANETLLDANSELATKYQIGQLIQVQSSSSQTFNMTLKIVGVAALDSTAALILGAYYGAGDVFIGRSEQSILIVSWEQTYHQIVDWANLQNQFGNLVYYDVNAYVDVNLDRDRLISPWDLEGSVSRVVQVDARVSNIAAQYGLISNDSLLPQLQSLAPSLLLLRLTFIVFSIPVFFMAWYVGRTVSQSSFNLRRREIGLLMTKGFQQSQLFRHFLVEALLVGLVSGAAGLALAITLNPFFVQALSGTYTGPIFLSRETAIITIVFTTVLTILAVFTPARQASAMDPARALREYVYVEDVRASRKRGALVAFSLGLYKIILLILGINFVTLARIGFSGGALVFIIIIVLGIVDFGLTFTGPFLFLYGATQISTGLAAWFHSKFSAISRKLVGDIATLSSKNVFRNPRRVTSLVFLVALIAGYSIWVTGDLASMEDYNFRQAKTRVGSDLRITNLGSNASTVADQIKAWTNVTGATVEQEAQLNLPSLGSNIRLKAIDPTTWRQGAYYEQEWFSDNLDTLLDLMSQDQYSIILDRGLASYFDIRPGGTLNVTGTLTATMPGFFKVKSFECNKVMNITRCTLMSSPLTVSLRIIGLFGPDYSQSSGGTIITPATFPFFYSQGWSYIAQSLVSQYPSFFSTSNSTLVMANNGVSLSALAESIRKAYPSAIVETAETNPQSTAGIVFNGTLNVLRLGTVFAAAAACIGVGTVSYTGFKEREKETTMIAVRGFSYRQLLGLLMTEVLPLVIFALILATVVGLITVRGDTLALNSLNFSPDYYSLLSPRRLVFPVWAQSTLSIIVGLLLLGVFLPAIVFARKDLSKMSRTVRFA